MFKFFKSKIKKIGSKLKKFSIGKKLKDLFSKKIDEDLFEELEKILYESDLGAKTSIELTEKIKEIFKKNPQIQTEEILTLIKQELKKEIIPIKIEKENNPQVIMIVGVNGSGKTTSLAKLVNHYKNFGKKVLIAAADTYRAAAVEQVDTWAKRLDVNIVKSQMKSDPSSVVYDALEAAKARKADVVIIDTAGRLHTKTDLMHELEKIKRVSNKVIEGSPHETILVLDATTGQNALDQAKIFNKFTPISAIFLTKLDGTAKGGIVISIQKELKIPIKWVGTGETIEDIDLFDPEKFLDDLLAIS